MLPIMHIGSFDDEPASFARMEAYCKEEGFLRTAKTTNREIYLSDPRRVPKDKVENCVALSGEKPMKTTFLTYGFYIKDPDILPIWVERRVHDMENLPSVHQHDFYELVYVVHGKAQHFFEGNYYDIYTGDILLIKPGENHTYALMPGDTFEIINCLFLSRFFEEDWLLLADKNLHIPSFLEQPFFKKSEGFHHRLSLSREDANQVRPAAGKHGGRTARKRSRYTMVIRLQLLELLFVLIRCHEEWLFRDLATITQHSERIMIVNRVLHYLEENIEQKPDLTLLASSYHISSRHLNRLFKQDTGMTVMEMTHHIRIEKAKQLLANTSDRIIDISGKVG